jgi:hypothetical protein
MYKRLLLFPAKHFFQTPPVFDGLSIAEIFVAVKNVYGTKSLIFMGHFLC